MRCYFMRNGHIASVEILEDVTDDAAAIKIGGAHFARRRDEGFEGFEIWERERVVFRYPEDENRTDPTAGKAKSTPRPLPRSKKASSQAISCAL